MTVETLARTAPVGSGRNRDEPPRRIVIQYPSPAVDGGRYPIKRCVGDTVEVSVDVFRDGHEIIRAVLRHRAPDGRSGERLLQRVDAHLGGVRWTGRFVVDCPGRWEYTVEAWTDQFGTWRDELARKVAAGQEDLSGELSEGVVLLRAAAEHAGPGGVSEQLERVAGQLEDPGLTDQAKQEIVLRDELADMIEADPIRHGSVTLERPLVVEVDRLRARFGAWYEMFPRSWGGLRGVEAQIPQLAELGFDVVYLPPIHPIGLTNRKGRDNALLAGPGDPGSPWAIGDASGGHDAVHPELGTHDDLRSLCATAAQHGIDIALDFAIQASADHPWLTEHPEWFHRRPDGTLKYAENPPKRYQDIYNVNWECSDWRGLWEALLRAALTWVDCGVRVFRVDNPHTKPFAFWTWLIDEIHAREPDVLFLAEAFTKRSVMRHLAKIGFSQSYTYFTWKNGRWELTEYVSELAYSGEQEYFRPNFFANTPDILHAYLQEGGRPAFEARLVLAATLSPSYGIYSGFEHYENVAVAVGSEEYLHSEKYEIHQRALDGPLLPMVRRLNEIRREHPALQELSNITFLETGNDGMIAYLKRTGGDTLITIVCLDAHAPQEAMVTIPASAGVPPAFTAHDLLSGERYAWRIGQNFVRLAPGWRMAHVLTVEL
ncbi:MAG TPA: alpha-1,4-glucan--maltose-1-phosphate maltosyltransferase [Solirubrobacteraceae bacterium]|nr:alpha-1,4-glucan--maltose-1-phosphate maltosyltransferase [Solirubrobacteraceae bacterium]